MAEANAEKLAALIAEIETESADVRAMLEAIAEHIRDNILMPQRPRARDMPTPEELRAKQKHLAELLRDAKKLAKAPADPNATTRAQGAYHEALPRDGATFRPSPDTDGSRRTRSYAPPGKPTPRSSFGRLSPTPSRHGSARSTNA